MTFTVHSSRTDVNEEVDAYRAALQQAVMKSVVGLAERAWIRVAGRLSFGFSAGGARRAKLQYVPVIVERRR